MRTFILTVLQVLCAIAILPNPSLHAQSPPADFSISVTTGGTGPWSQMVQITIDHNGQGRFLRYKTGGHPGILADTSFTLSASDLQQIWKTVQDSSFFSLSSDWSDTTIRDGSFALVAVTANGTTHQVNITNVGQPAIQAIIKSLNSVVPSNVQLDYTPPEKFDSTPRDTCRTFGAPGKLSPERPGLRDLYDQKTRGFPGPYFPPLTKAVPLEASHPGVVVSCEKQIQQAVADGVATLSSKGNFFGDGVTITVDDRNPPPCDKISIKIYLEFWGPDATDANALPIIADIYKAWEGARTSSGQEIDVSVIARLNAGATDPPNTPGYDDILLLGKGYRSNVNKLVPVNDGTGSGTWEINGDPGEYAHEVGHLMGLPDRYDDYNKQPDGSWKNANTGQTYANNDDFANYAATKFPDLSLADIKNTLQLVKVYGIPRDGHENDLMGNLDGKLLQSDIDIITAHPGLLVHVPAGTIFPNRDNTAQNLIVTHEDDIYARPGERRIVFGIYIACVDHHKGIPERGSFFDVAPPLSQWTGIRAAGYLETLLHFVDSVGLYCPLDIATQELIWRISDNMPLLGDPQADSILSAAGISITDQMFDFPKMTGSSATDSASHLFLPDQLYKANIQPAYASGQVGTAARFTASVLHPSGTPAPVGISWTAIGPDGAPVSIGGTDSTASLTPSRSGVYQVGLNMSMNDSLHGSKSISPDQKGYVIVPDQYTETFEHSGLTEKYPWQSYGDVPWTITNSNPETGSYAAQPANVDSYQKSTLGIDVSLPADSVIVFSVRSFIGVLLSNLTFSVDSVYVDSFHNGFDWRVCRYPIHAGKHRLTWSFSTPFAIPGNSVWLDNIFFPGNVVVTSVSGAAPDLPKVFALEQNYPNPFNPFTIIKYTVGGTRGQGPGSRKTRLVVYDVLGRQVATLVDEEKAPGSYEVRFDGSGLSSGVYFYRMTAGSFVQTRKLTVLK